MYMLCLMNHIYFLEAVHHFEKITSKKYNRLLNKILFKEVDLNNSACCIYSQFDSKDNDFKLFSPYIDRALNAMTEISNTDKI